MYHGPPITHIDNPSRYRVGPEIGRGGMGIVHEATDTLLRRKVAVKLLPDDHGAIEDRRQRFIQEAQAASALNHPNIVTVHDVVSAEGHTFIVMEFIEGTPLTRVIKAGAIPPSQLLDYARQISGALAAAHAVGLVHRDIKPANVMITRDGCAKVLDFGLSKLVSSGGPAGDETRTVVPPTREGVVMGSWGYMSPEQAVGAPVDARTDVFSLGVLLYEMAAGRRPFSGDSVQSLLAQSPPPLAEARTDIPSAFEALVVRCLEKAPERRPASAVVHRELRDIATSLGVGRSPSSPPSRLWIWATAAAVALLAALGGWVWTSAKRAADERERVAAGVEVSRLVDEGHFVNVWRVAYAALERWPGESQLLEALRASTDTVTIRTDPAGAAVSFKAYTDVEGAWIPLGVTPLLGVRAPLGMLRWRVHKAGFEPIEARLEVGAPSAAAGRPDVESRPLRLVPEGMDKGMAFVPGTVAGVALTDFSIDRTEVTNRAFKKFVDRGGYDDPRLWVELARQLPSRVDKRGAPIGLVDRTGRPGPSTWELGTYPTDQDGYPVSGVSWFEAVAYCASIDMRLPTVYHWRRALGSTFFMEVVRVGNFDGRGPEDVRSLKDVGPHGTYGLAGNVKEWTSNAFQGQRYILGGAWSEPIYMATSDDTRPPLDRAEVNGFRCMQERAPSAPVAYAPVAPSDTHRDPARLKSATNAEFEIFRRFYAYDKTPLESRVEKVDAATHWRRERVSFSAAYPEERVLANLFIPLNAKPPYQVVVWFPGSYALFLTSTAADLPFSQYFDFVPRSGRVLVYPVYAGTYERRASRRRVGQTESATSRRDQVVRWSMDLSRTLDYLETRGDMDMGRVSYYGYSLGAGGALPILAVERRLVTAILLAGGLLSKPEVPEIDPVNFVPRITLPVLLLNGRYDFTFPVKSAQQPLFNLIGTPAAHKRHVIFEEAGHVPPRLGVIRETLDWLDRYLGLVPCSTVSNGAQGR